MKKLNEYETPETDAKYTDDYYLNGYVDEDHARDLERRLAMCRDALKELMPFVIETYYPECATSEFKSAVENAQETLKATEPK